MYPPNMLGLSDQSTCFDIGGANAGHPLVDLHLAVAGLVLECVEGLHIPLHHLFQEAL